MSESESEKEREIETQRDEERSTDKIKSRKSGKEERTEINIGKTTGVVCLEGNNF